MADAAERAAGNRLAAATKAAADKAPAIARIAVVKAARAIKVVSNKLRPADDGAGKGHKAARAAVAGRHKVARVDSSAALVKAVAAASIRLPCWLGYPRPHARKLRLYSRAAGPKN